MNTANVENRQTNNKKRGNILYLIVPCYNEEEVIPASAGVLCEKVKRLMKQELISKKSKILFVNDGSSDKTWEMIHSLCAENTIFCGISFSKNCGHQNAILAGMMKARDYADMVVTIDADLQQDIEALDSFIEAYQEGCEVVYGVRKDRHSDKIFKKFTAGIFYYFMHLLGCDVMSNHADYRLMSKKALDALSEYKEVNLFLRGLIPTLGFQSGVVFFDVKERAAGTSKYTLKKMTGLAANGITSMSTRPIQFITVMGFIVSIFSVCMIVYILIDWISGNNVPGYTTTLTVSLLMGGLTIFSLGIVGEYIGKIYMETKGRPRYIIESYIWKDTVSEESDEIQKDEGQEN